MGDNATASWGWHNTVVGEGYQAKGVVRQPGPNSVKVLDLRKAEQLISQTNLQAVVSFSHLPKESEEKSKRNRDAKDRSRNERHEKKRREEKEDGKKDKKHKKKSSKKKNRSDKESSSPNDVDVSDKFNPLLQYLASCISNRTRSFSLEND